MLKKDSFSSRKYRKPFPKEFTDTEMRTFDTELEAFRTRKTLDSGKEITYIDQQAYLVSKRAISPSGGIIIEELTHDDGWDCLPILYEELTYKLNQWAKWKGKKEYAEKMAVVDLSKLAEQMSI